MTRYRDNVFHVFTYVSIIKVENVSLPQTAIRTRDHSYNETELSSLYSFVPY